MVHEAKDVPEGWHFAVGRWNGTVDLRLEGTSTAGRVPPSTAACLETLEGAIMAAEANKDAHAVDALLLQRAKARVEPLRKVLTEAPLKLALAEASLDQPTSLMVLDEELPLWVPMMMSPNVKSPEELEIDSAPGVESRW